MICEYEYTNIAPTPNIKLGMPLDEQSNWLVSNLLS